MMMAASCFGDTFIQKINRKIVKVNVKMDGPLFRPILEKDFFNSSKDLRLQQIFTLHQDNNLKY